MPCLLIVDYQRLPRIDLKQLARRTHGEDTATIRVMDSSTDMATENSWMTVASVSEHSRKTLGLSGQTRLIFQSFLQLFPFSISGSLGKSTPHADQISRAPESMEDSTSASGIIPGRGHMTGPSWAHRETLRWAMEFVSLVDGLSFQDSFWFISPVVVVVVVVVAAAAAAVIVIVVAAVVVAAAAIVVFVSFQRSKTMHVTVLQRLCLHPKRYNHTYHMWASLCVCI